MLQIDVFSDVVCPWCYVGKHRLEQALALLRDERPEVEVTVNWLPFELDPDVPEGGLPYRDALVAKFGSLQRLEASQLQLAQAGEDAGVDFHFDRIETRPNTLQAHRLIQWAQRDGAGDALKEALFRAYFQDGRDIGDVLVLADVAEEIGLEGERAMRFLASEEGTEAVRQWEAAAQRLGIGGVPFFIFNRALGVSGAQAPEALLSVMREALDGGGAA